MDTFVFGLDENNNAALRVSPGQGETNQKDIFTTDDQGNAAIRVIGAGGGSVDYNRVIEKSSSIPTADADTYRKVYMYVGETDANYTHGYIYECQKTSATYTGTVTFEAATLSGTTVACDGDDFANFLTEAGADPTPIVSGTMTYDAGADGWRLVGKDAEDNTVTNFIEYTEDYTDYGFVFTGTPVDGDVVGFTCSVSESSATYGWVRLDVQPAPSGLPDQTGQSGKFLTTDGTDASWSDKPLVNNNPRNTTSIMIGNIGSTIDSIGVGSVCLTSDDTYGGWVGLGNSSVAIGTQSCAGSNSVAIGSACSCGRNYSTIIGYSAASYGNTSSNHNIALGAYTIAGAAGASTVHAIQIGSTGSTTTNSDSNTLKIANANGNFEMMSADGTIPTARLTKVNTTVTLAVADWSSNTQTVSVTGMTATGVVMVSPVPADQSAYTTAGIICTAQAEGTLTFTCSTTPSAAIDVNVVML